MEYVVVMDSCGERTAAMKEDERIVSAPLTMQVDEYMIVDDDTFDQADFLKKVAESPNSPKSACPSPDYYKEAFAKALTMGRPVVIDCQIDCDDKVWPMVAPGAAISEAFSEEDLQTK